MSYRSSTLSSRVCGTPLGWVRTSLVGLVTTTSVWGNVTRNRRMALTPLIRSKVGFYSREHCRGSSLPSPQSSTTLHTLLRATQRPLPHWNSLSRQESTVVAIRTQTNTGQKHLTRWQVFEEEEEEEEGTVDESLTEWSRNRVFATKISLALLYDLRSLNSSSQKSGGGEEAGCSKFRKFPSQLQAVRSLYYDETCSFLVNDTTTSRPRIPQIRVSNTRLAQAASGCAPSVDVLPIFDVKQQSVRNPARMGGVRTSLVGLVTTTKQSVWGKESLPSAPTDDESRQ
ncbi:hypothetical protein WN51_13496 [Melipona quadrifasciata]|uniref:Uncharacterized protein n=1 Tax=Melipona quadrifasciata TaxID=166423 RepID=A0A0M9A0L4_9HYME|nr:hypothetical protein WN51_13496 [Melipona quadrifasciata]